MSSFKQFTWEGFMLGRHLWAVAAVWLVVGCAATPEVETRSYTLQNRVAEEALIKGKLDDEAARLGNERMAKMVQRAGGTLDTFKVVDDNTAIVRTTARGHSEIEKALVRARNDAVDAQRRSPG